MAGHIKGVRLGSQSSMQHRRHPRRRPLSVLGSPTIEPLSSSTSLPRFRAREGAGRMRAWTSCPAKRRVSVTVTRPCCAAAVADAAPLAAASAAAAAARALAPASASAGGAAGAASAGAAVAGSGPGLGCSAGCALLVPASVFAPAGAPGLRSMPSCAIQLCHSAAKPLFTLAGFAPHTQVLRLTPSHAARHPSPCAQRLPSSSP